MMSKDLLDPTSVAAALHTRSDRNRKEQIIQIVMLACAVFSIFITISIVFILLETAVTFFTDQYFFEVGSLVEAVRQLAQEQGVSSEDLNQILIRANDIRDVTFRRMGEGLGLTPEQVMERYQEIFDSRTGLERLWATVSTSLSRFFGDARWTPLFGSKRFGIWPLINGTAMVTLVAMSVAVPLGLLTALYLGIYASRDLARTMRPMVEILAGIPTVVYGYFALQYITPVLQWGLGLVGIQVPIFNVLSAGIMMGVMILPTVGSISLDSINAVPRALHDGAYALGATKMEVALKVVFPAAVSGIFSSVILGISRAVGETMIVTVAGGQQPVSYGEGFFGVLGSIFSPFQSMATMTAYIAQVSLGDSPFGSIQYKTLFAVGVVLFSITLSLNIISRMISERIRNVYE
jgi:phosphate transport system permease protein